MGEVRMNSWNLDQKEMDEIIWRKNVPVEPPFKKTTMRITKGMLWYTKFDPTGKPFAYYGKRLKGGKK